MEKKVIVLYGNVLPPYRHIEKIVLHYGRYYERDRCKDDYDENQYDEVWVSFRFTDAVPEGNAYTTLSVPVKKGFLPKFLSIFEALKGSVRLCKINHSHPTIELSGITCEGYCYICSDGKKLFFMESYCDEEGNEFSIHRLGWYHRVPEEKRWFIASGDKDTNEEFARWAKSLISSYA